MKTKRKQKHQIAGKALLRRSADAVSQNRRDNGNETCHIHPSRKSSNKREKVSPGAPILFIPAVLP